MGMLDKVAVARRMCPIIFLLDTSASMEGQPIEALNKAMEEVITEIVDMNENNPDIEILMGVLKFNFSASWETGDNLVNPKNFSWNYLDVNGFTAMGGAFCELNKALSTKHGFMKRATGSVAPVLFLLSDGDPTDAYEEALNELKNNNWYKVAVKVAVGYGEANDEILTDFTGNRETVLHTNNAKDLKKLIRFVAITSSMVASKGSISPSTSTNNGDSDDATKILAVELQASLSDNSDDEW